jgi:hypothetical protein
VIRRPCDTEGMLVAWAAECSADDPILVVPWKDPDSAAAFIDLRENPYDLDHVAEAAEHPPLMQALRALNATRSPVFTAKCDAWAMDADELEELRLELDLIAAETPAGFASYIDLVWRDRTVFASFHQHEQMLRRLERLAAPLDLPAVAIDCVVRPAMVDLSGAREGYALSLYVKAAGADRQSAWQQWSVGLAAVVGMLRGRDFKR